MSFHIFGRREKHRIEFRDVHHDLEIARSLYHQGDFLSSFDIYEQMIGAYSEYSVALLADLFDRYQMLPSRNRYNLYQSRHFHFGIRPGDKVLDIGSGHIPFPLATHLSDITLDDHGYGRAGVPFKHLEGKPVYECNIENIPFSDKEFDFVYCSHVLEHAESPEKACRELMRIARRGFIECPSRGKDIFLNSAGISHHKWGVDLFGARLIFSEYTPEEIEALQCDILQQMHSDPQSMREKAFSALIYLKADLVNAMLLWEDGFEYEVRRHRRACVAGDPADLTKSTPECGSIDSKVICCGEDGKSAPISAVDYLDAKYESDIKVASAPSSKLRFVQVHTFYTDYLSKFYKSNPNLGQAPFNQQIDALIRDGFSGIHMFAPYMDGLGYDSELIIANNPISQSRWLEERGETLSSPEDWVREITRRQIELMEPEVLYLSDPILFDSHFIRSLSRRPRLILGWRAATIPQGTDWSELDVMMSSLSALREAALEIGAKAVEHFFPGYPSWINNLIHDTRPSHDVVFSGQWTLGQHPRRNQYLRDVARASIEPGRGFSCAFYLSGEVDTITPEVARHNFGGRFGVSMYRALRSGKIALDARGILETTHVSSGARIDLAGRETANMRIFEVTGAGAFLLTEHHDNLRQYFTPGEEIETFHDERELVDKIRYYLSHPEDREAIARRGQARCLREYSIEKRAGELDRIIRCHLERKKAPSRTRGGEMEGLKEMASRLLESGNSREALDSLVRAKSLREPLMGIDLLRARCFLHMNQTDGAVEALREELRYFPSSFEAKQLLARLEESTVSQSVRGADDPEIQELLKLIRPYTMLSPARLYSLFTLAKDICQRNIPGNFVECGVAAGGSSALLAYVIKRYSSIQRRLIAFDSFSGMPEPTPPDTHVGQPANDTGWGTGTCAAPEESVKEICARLGVLDVVTTVKGYFEDTLPAWRDRAGMIALLHLDGDWYESTRSILANLYDRITSDGILQVDDYGHWEGCRKAIHEFEADRGVRFALKAIDGTGVWFTRPDPFPTNPKLSEKLIAEFNQIDPIPMGIKGQMSPNERFQLYYALSELLPDHFSPLRFVEVGSYAGGSLALIYQTLRKAGRRMEGFCIEPNGQPGLSRILEQMGPHVTHLPMLSFEAAPQLKEIFSDGNQPGFIFIDGDHSYEGVRRDIIDYYPLLAPGGLILFHDYLPPLNDVNREAILAHHGGKEPGIRHACEEIMEARFGCQSIDLPLLYPTDPTQTQAGLPIIPGVFSTIRAYRKPIRKDVTETTRGCSRPSKIVHLCSSEVGGAGTAAYRLHAGLREAGEDSTHLVLIKQSNDPSVKLVPPTTPGTMASCLDTTGVSPAWHTAARRWHHLLAQHPDRPAGLEMYSDAWANVHLDCIREVREADIINLHWVAGMVDYGSMAKAFAGKKIVWTLHDMNPFTGGCHYAGQCEKYQTMCQACPQLGSRDNNDMARMVWEAKRHAFRKLNITVVTPSRWLAECAARSALFARRTIQCLPYGLPTDIYQPYDRNEIRSALGIPTDAKVVLFGADNVLNTRKGFEYLLRALGRYRSAHADSIMLVTFGNLDPSIDLDSPYPVRSLGFISGDKQLACVYSLADVFVIPSLEDNLPNTVLEAMACGVPVVGFDIGGIPDMVQHGKTGFLATPQDVDSLIEGIEWALFSDPREEIRQACRSSVLRSYSLPVMTSNYVSLYRKPAQTPIRIDGGRKCHCSVNTSDAAENTNEQARTNCNPQGNHAPHGSYSFGTLPRISILTPSFNQARFLEECIDSILSQGYSNLEYTIMDGGSTDGSVEIIKRYEKYLSHWQSMPDGGQYFAIDDGFRLATGSIMSWLNSDDKLHPNSLRTVASAFLDHEHVEWITGRPSSIDEQSRLTFISSYLPIWERAKYLNRDYRNPYIQQEGTFWKKSLWVRAGSRIDTSYALAGDLELWARFFRYSQLYSIDAVLGAFRSHPAQKTARLLDRYHAEAEKIIDGEIEHYTRGSSSSPLHAAPKPIAKDNGQIMVVGYWGLTQRQFEEARLNYARVLETDPLNAEALQGLEVLSRCEQGEMA